MLATASLAQAETTQPIPNMPESPHDHNNSHLAHTHGAIELQPAQL